jgi:hypothetical protein
MPQLIRVSLQQPVIPLTPVPLSVLPTSVHHLRSSQYDGYGECAETDGMTERILGRVALEVDKGTDEGRAVRDGDKHAYTYCPNVMWGEIV